MQISDNRRCFICGPDNPLGLRVKPSRDKDAGRAWLAVTIPDDYQGWAGIVHGGVIGALLDEVSVYAALAVARQIVTAELTVRYLKPVPTGREVRVEARIREQVRRSVFVDAELLCDGVVLASSEARLVVPRNMPL